MAAFSFPPFPKCKDHHDHIPEGHLQKPQAKWTLSPKRRSNQPPVSVEVQPPHVKDLPSSSRGRPVSSRASPQRRESRGRPLFSGSEVQIQHEAMISYGFLCLQLWWWYPRNGGFRNRWVHPPHICWFIDSKSEEIFFLSSPFQILPSFVPGRLSVTWSCMSWLSTASSEPFPHVPAILLGLQATTSLICLRLNILEFKHRTNVEQLQKLEK